MTIPKLEQLAAARTGHPDIDADHVELARIIDSIADAVGSQEGAEACRKLLDSFITGEVEEKIAEKRKVVADIWGRGT